MHGHLTDKLGSQCAKKTYSNLMFPLALEGAVHVKDSVVLLALLVWVTPWSLYKKMIYVKNNETILIKRHLMPI